MLVRAGRDVLEAISDAVAKALKRLGRPAEVEEPKEVRDEGGNVKGFRVRIYCHHLAAFLEHVAGRVKAELAEVWLESWRVVVIEAEVEFKLVKRGDVTFLLAQDLEQTLRYTSLSRRWGRQWSYAQEHKSGRRDHVGPRRDGCKKMIKKVSSAGCQRRSCEANKYKSTVKLPAQSPTP